MDGGVGDKPPRRVAADRAVGRGFGVEALGEFEGVVASRTVIVVPWQAVLRAKKRALLQAALRLLSTIESSSVANALSITRAVGWKTHKPLR